MQHRGALLIGVADRSISVNLSKLDSPQHEYDADVAWVEHKPGDVRILFGKKNRDNKGSLKTRVEIRYPVEAFVRHFWGNSRDFHGRLRRFVEKWQIGAVEDAQKPSEMTAERDHSEWANFDYMSHSGTEASVDFFHLPPSGLARFVRNQEDTSGLEIAAVLRVHLTVHDLLRLLDNCQAVAADIEAYVPTEAIEVPGARNAGAENS